MDSELEYNIKAIEAMGFKVKNNSISTELDIFHKSEDKSYFQIKDMDEVKGIVSFYFSAFNNKDSDSDIVMPGSFTKTIKENKSRVKHLSNHNTTKSPGVILELGQDSHGAFAVSQLYKAPHTIGQDILIEYASGGITEHSMGYKVIKGYYDKAQSANIITEVFLWEVSSLTAWGANSKTPMRDLKSLKNNTDYLKILNNIKI